MHFGHLVLALWATLVLPIYIAFARSDEGRKLNPSELLLALFLVIAFSGVASLLLISVVALWVWAVAGGI